MYNKKLVLYFTILSVAFLGWWMISIENEFYVIQKEKLEIEREEVETEIQKVLKEKNERKTADIEFSIKMSKMDLSVEGQIRKVAAEHNFKWTDYLVRLAQCESTLNPQALGDSGQSRGLFQIHRGYHPEISDECAFNLRCATEWTMDRINAGYQHEWTCNEIVLNK